MKLSELRTGEKGVIVKVLGHGGFRKRIVEMGFIKGKVVEVLLNAPLQDPVKYKIMGYEVSLRHKEADMIEIVSTEEAKALESEYEQAWQGGEMTEQRLHNVAMKKRRTINVALVGNPNCGKTSLFNFVSGAHERVGNYSGVTVDAKEGHASFEGYEFNIVDLPGTYSLSAYSPEEMYVRRQIIDKTPDIILNVLDASNLERNLYLTTQLIDMHPRMICALNMYDEFEERGDSIDYKKLGQLLGVPMVPTVFKSGKGVKTLFHIIINLYEGVDFIDKKGNINPEVAKQIQDWHKEYDDEGIEEHSEDFAHGNKPNNSVFRHIHLNHGTVIEKAIETIQKELRNESSLRHKYSTRYLSIKLLEKDREAEKVISELPDGKVILAIRDKEAKRISDEMQEDPETAIMDAKYAIIHGALHEAAFEIGHKTDTYQATHVIDALITNRYAGFPIFILLLYIMFQATFSIGQYPMDWIDAGFGALGELVASYMPDGMLKDMIADGIIGGVGAVIVFCLRYSSSTPSYPYGGLRLYGEGGVHHGQIDAQDGTAWQVVHPSDYGIRLQCARRDGHPHYREQALAHYHHAHSSDDELFGATAYLYNDYGDVLRREIPESDYHQPLCARHIHRRGDEPHLQQMACEGRRYPICHGASSLSNAHGKGYRETYMGERQAVSEEDGRCHPRGKYHHLGTWIFPA